MAKYEQPFEDTQEIFSKAIDATGLQNYITITVLSNNKSKKIFDVIKANELVKFRTGDDVFIVLNEKIFEGLTDEQKAIVAEQALAFISFDSENDKLVITKPDFLEHTGILAKYGFDIINVLKESIKTLYQAEEQEEAEDVQTTN